MSTVLDSGQCICTANPFDNSAPPDKPQMEGYNEGEEYYYEHMIKDAGGLYYRVYHSTEPESRYYECCGVGTFKQHFRILKVPGSAEDAVG